MKHKPNLRFIGLLLAAGLVVGEAVRYLHDYQVKRNAYMWLQQADQAENKGNGVRCLLLLGRYLSLFPKDVDVLARFGAILIKQHGSAKARWQAFALLEQVLTRQPDRVELRQQIVYLTMSLGRYADARQHLAILLQSSSHQAENEYLLGQCLEEMADYSNAALWYDKAAHHDHGNLQSFTRLAGVLRSRLDQPERARDVMDQMVTANSTSHGAYVQRARFLKEMGALEEAFKDFAQACRLAPDEIDGLVAVASMATSEATFAEARQLLQNAIKSHAQEVALYLALANLECRANQPSTALRYLQLGLANIPDQPALLRLACDILIDRDDIAKAEEYIACLKKADDHSATAGYWHARLLIQQHLWQEAATELENARRQLTQDAEWLIAVDLALGICYENQGDHDRELAAYQRVLLMDSASGPAHVGAGSALLRMGRLSEALGEFRLAIQWKPVPHGAWLGLAKVLYLNTLRNSPEIRDWREVGDAIAQALKCPSQSVPAMLLRAKMLQAQNQIEQARQALKKAMDLDPLQMDLWLALAEIEGQTGNLGRADQILHEAEQRLGNQSELRLARFRLLSRSGGQDSRLAQQDLEHHLADFPASKQMPLVMALAQSYAQGGDWQTAERLYRGVAADYPHDLTCRQQLVDLYAHLGKDADFQATVDEMRHIEGHDGIQWRSAELSRLLVLANAGHRETLEQARELLAGMASQHPSWPRLYIFQGSIDELDGHSDRAITHYFRALEGGERPSAMMLRLARILFEKRRIVEADRVIQQLKEQTPLEGKGAKLAAEIALANHDLPQAIALARHVAADRPGDYRETLWLCQVLESAGESQEAEGGLRSLLHKNGQIPDAWVALVSFLVRSGQTPKAKAALRDAAKILKPALAPLALGACWEILGNPLAAEKQYQAALADSPADFLVLRRVAEYYLRTSRASKALPFWRRLIDPDVESDQETLTWARHNLALSLSASGEPFLDEALTLVDQNLVRYPHRPEDSRLKAKLLSALPARQREAIVLLEQSRDMQPLPVDDQLLLVKLYESVDDRPKAREQILSLLSQSAPDPTYFGLYIRALIRWGENVEARIWLAKLETLEPHATQTRELKKFFLQTVQDQPNNGG